MGDSLEAARQKYRTQKDLEGAALKKQHPSVVEIQTSDKPTVLEIGSGKNHGQRAVLSVVTGVTGKEDTIMIDPKFTTPKKP